MARHINAEHLRLSLVARKLRPGTRWAAMSDGAATHSCRPRPLGSGWMMHLQPTLAPMASGSMRTLLERARAQGRGEVLRTWRTSIAVLKAEFSTCVLRAQASQRGAAS